MIHTGTSIFPAARNKFGDPIFLDDVARGFSQTENPDGPRRPSHLDDDGVFPVAPASQRASGHQRHPAEILLKYFPRLEEIAHKTLFGTDWPSPGIPDIKQNLDQFQELLLPPAVKEQILSRNALEMWPGR